VIVLIMSHEVIPTTDSFRNEAVVYAVGHWIFDNQFV